MAGLLDDFADYMVKQSIDRTDPKKPSVPLSSQVLSALQGASNAAASNLSAPVDGLAWLLRKAGVPIPSNPVGGSDWMAQQGLTREPQNRNAGLLGEAIGGVLPMVAAAKAPQIAKGLLQVEANAMAPRTLNKETGAIVWHGSPHKFDKFDASKIGTGEGAQAYGHGIYVADNPTVAKNYQAKVSAMQGSGEPTIAGRPINWDSPEEAAAFEIARHNGDRQAAADFYAKTFRAPKTESLIRSGENLPSVDLPGNLYKVDLPDEHIARMLDWDAPLNRQSDAVKNALEPLMPQIRKAAKTDESLGGYLGKGIYEMLGDGKASPQTAKMLQQAGIPGIRYLDGGSRGTGAGTSNFVVFPGNEHLLQILERNGKGLLEN